jgi:hypothetical protein
MSVAKCGSTLASALKTAPALLALVDAHAFRRQEVPSATAAWDLGAPDLAAIDVRKGGDHRTISRNRAPATNHRSIT